MTLIENHGKKRDVGPSNSNMKPVTITARLHTVFLLVGPSRCGKTTFAGQLANALTREYTKIVTAEENGSLVPTEIISSDAYRKMLFGKYDDEIITDELQETSSQAFSMLMTHLDNVTQFPVNRKFVIVDTTGLDETFRDNVRKMALKNNYHVQVVLFDYSHSEYQANIDQSDIRQKILVAGHSKRFKTKVMPSIRKSEWSDIVKIKSPAQASTTDVTIKEKSLPYRFLSGDDVYVIIGDTHEHVSALKEMIKAADNKFIRKEVRYVLLGDYIDKANQTKEMIDFIWTLVHTRGAILIQANHESYAYKRIKGELPLNAELERDYMTAVPVLMDPANKEYADKLVELWEKYSVPFLRIRRAKAHTVFVTHAPCPNKVLGKMTTTDFRDQRNIFRKNHDEDQRKSYEFIFKEASFNHPIHVFGHVAHKGSRLNYKNKWFLDTGAVYGHRLSALCISAETEEEFQIATTKLVDEKLPDNLTNPIQEVRNFNIADYKLSDNDTKFLNRLEKSEVKYISGTMAPAPSNSTEIESLLGGLRYFKNHGVKRVIIEPKYMGSRCQVYVFRDHPEKSFAVSRNGYVIKREGIQAVLDDQYAKYVAKGGWGNSLVVDGELMPWSFLGAGLIEHEFTPFMDAVSYELEDLGSDEELRKLGLYNTLQVEERKVHLKEFGRQLELYGKTSDPVFNGFGVLAIDGEAMLTKMDQIKQFDFVAGEGQLAIVVDLGDDENLSYEQAKAFFDEITTEKQMEGVVIKPVDYAEGVAPYMKVRNEGYLTLVYGYDMQMRYKALASRKRVDGKVRTSIKENELATRLLTAQDSERTELFVKMIAELNFEKTLDPRL